MLGGLAKEIYHTSLYPGHIIWEISLRSIIKRQDHNKFFRFQLDLISKLEHCRGLFRSALIPSSGHLFIAREKEVVMEVPGNRWHGGQTQPKW